MSLVPALAVDPAYTGSIDKAVADHLNNLNVEVDDDGKKVLRDICINVRKLQLMTGKVARNQTSSIADIRADVTLYNSILARQSGRCLWCGAKLSSPLIKETLEHVAPKHIGDDPIDGSNWAIVCDSCNNGKANALAWATKAEAHDYFHRTDFAKLNEITLAHRWAVLMRSRRCIKCNATTKEKELWVYRRVATGLPIPANCSITCEDCGAFHKLEILLPKWLPDEAGRGKPIY
jgi:hypothetical protein